MIIDDNKTLPDGWQWVKLGDVCDVTKLAGFEYTEHVKYSSRGEYIALRAQNVRNYGLDLQNIVYISKETASCLSRSKLNFGDVVMTFIGANIGEATWIDKNDTYYCAPNIAKITPNKKLLYYRFLTRVIHSPIIRQQIEELNKSTAQQSLSMQNIREFFLPIPPISEQKRIAAILEKCDRLRRTRRYALQLSDTLLQSVFLEMFGNPMANPMGWDKVTLSDIQTDFIYGTSTKCSYQKNGLPVLRIPNILGGEINTSDIKYAKLPDKEVKQLLLHQGDIVFVRTNGNLDYVGRCAVFNLSTSYLFASYLIRARLNLKKVNPWFLSAYIQTPLGRQIMSPFIRTTAGQFNISVEGLKQITIPLPPLPLQEKFAQTVQKFERLRTQQREAERQAEHLFQTLLHRAFRGELTSSDFNDEAVSVLSQEIRAQQTKPKSTADAAEYLRTKGKPQDTEAIQLTLPGLE